MLDPKDNSQFEQDRALLADIYPPMWRAIYKSCRKQGFTRKQSFKLVRDFIAVQAMVGCDPGIQSDDDEETQ